VGIVNRRAAVAALACGLCVHAAAAWAQAYPSKVIRWIVPSSAGGGADTVTRLVANALPPVLGQRVIVDNRAGASGNIGSELAAKSPPDGYTWLMINNAQAANVSMFRNLAYDLLRDFTPVTQVDSSPHVVVVHPSLPVKSIGELVRLAKAKPGALDYASAGLGTVTFLAAELFKADAGVNLRHVPYKGGGESLLSIVSGETAVYFSPLVVALPHMRTGRLRALAITSKARTPLAQDVPTVAESGYPDYAFSLWNGLLVAAKTPKDVVAAVRGAVVAVLNGPEVGKRFSEMGSAAIGSQPEEFRAFLAGEVERLAVVIGKLKLADEAQK
jgi:tripartite-type tricarboxylate transporter receptor subunit TctC